MTSEREQMTDWTGGRCPVRLFTKVDGAYRDGRSFLGKRAITLGWVHRGWDDDILAYKLTNLKSEDEPR